MARSRKHKPTKKDINFAILCQATLHNLGIESDIGEVINKIEKETEKQLPLDDWEKLIRS